MEFANETHQVTTFFSSYPESFHIFWFVVAFIINFFICRYVSIKLVTAGYIRKHPIVTIVDKKGKLQKAVNTKIKTSQFNKLFLFWFVPIVGVFGLITLYISCVMMKYVILAKQKLFLNHI